MTDIPDKAVEAAKAAANEVLRGATGDIVDLGGQGNILGRLRNLGLVEYGPLNDTWRITPAGRTALAQEGGRN